MMLHDNMITGRRKTIEYKVASIEAAPSSPDLRFRGVDLYGGFNGRDPGS
jgi:hypothetical protein